MEITVERGVSDLVVNRVTSIIEYTAEEDYYRKGYKEALKALKAEVENSPYTKSYEHETEYIPKHRVYEIIDRLRKDGEQDGSM